VVFEENGWLLLETGMYIPVRDPVSQEIIAEALPYQPPPPPAAANVENEDVLKVDEKNGNYDSQWVQSDFVAQMKRIVSLIDLCQEMLLEPSLTSEGMIMNESLQLMIQDLVETQQQVAQMMDTLTVAKCLEFVFKIKNIIETTLKLQEFVYTGGPRPNNVRINKQSLVETLDQIEKELQSENGKGKLEISSVSDDIGEVSHDEIGGEFPVENDDPFGLDTAMVTSDKAPEPESIVDLDAFVAEFKPPTATGDPFAQTTKGADPFASNSGDPFATKAVDPFAQTQPAIDPFSQVQQPVDPFASAMPTKGGGPFATPSQPQDPFNLDVFQSQPKAQTLDPFAAISTPAEPGSPNVVASQPGKPVDPFNFASSQPGNLNILNLNAQATTSTISNTQDQTQNSSIPANFFSSTGTEVKSEQPSYVDPFADVVGETPFQEPSPNLTASFPGVQPSPNLTTSLPGVQPSPILQPFSQPPPPQINFDPFAVNNNPGGMSENPFETAPTQNPFTTNAANPFAVGNTPPVNPFATPSTVTPQKVEKPAEVDPFASLGDPFAGFKSENKTKL